MHSLKRQIEVFFKGLFMGWKRGSEKDSFCISRIDLLNLEKIQRDFLWKDVELDTTRF